MLSFQIILGQIQIPTFPTLKRGRLVTLKRGRLVVPFPAEKHRPWYLMTMSHLLRDARLWKELPEGAVTQTIRTGVDATGKSRF
jgi:hypothetical protein